MDTESEESAGGTGFGMNGSGECSELNCGSSEPDWSVTKRMLSDLRMGKRWIPSGANRTLQLNWQSSRA
jgi:hypothetical protein